VSQEDRITQAIGHLVIVRSAAQALITNVDAALKALSDVGEEEVTECQHIESEPVTGLGISEKPRRRCKACGKEWEVEATW
jgi:hypothetical protein